MRPLILAILLTLLCAVGARASDPFASPAVDPKVINPEAMRRVTGQVGNWNFVCDEIALLQKRMCSVVSVLRNEAGAAIGSFIVSTDERGKPAALLRLLSPILVGAGARLDASYEIVGPKKQKKTINYVEHVFFNACDKNLCTAFVYLKGEAVYALSVGRPLHLNFVSPKLKTPNMGRLFYEIVQNNIVIDGGGFADALKKAAQ